MNRAAIITGLLLVPTAAAAEEALIPGSVIVQIVGIVVPILGTLALAWINLRAGQKQQNAQIAAVEIKTTSIETKAQDLDKKVDGVRADVAQVHEATNGLSHRLSEAAGEAGYGRGQEKERRDERLRVAEAAAVVVPQPAAIPAAIIPLPAEPDVRTVMLARIEGLLREFHALGNEPGQSGLPNPPGADPVPGAKRETLRDAVATIQEKTDKLTFSTPNVVDAAPPDEKK